MNPYLAALPYELNSLFSRSYSIESAPRRKKSPALGTYTLHGSRTCLRIHIMYLAPHFFLAAAPKAPSFVRIRRVGRHQTLITSHHSQQFTAHHCQGLLHRQIAGPTYTAWISYMPPHVYLAPHCTYFIPNAAPRAPASLVRRVGRHHCQSDTHHSLQFTAHHRQGLLHHHIVI